MERPVSSELIVEIAGYLFIAISVFLFPVGVIVTSNRIQGGCGPVKPNDVHVVAFPWELVVLLPLEEVDIPTETCYPVGVAVLRPCPRIDDVTTIVGLLERYGGNDEPTIWHLRDVDDSFRVPTNRYVSAVRGEGEIGRRNVSNERVVSIRRPVPADLLGNEGELNRVVVQSTERHVPCIEFCSVVRVVLGDGLGTKGLWSIRPREFCCRGSSVEDVSDVIPVSCSERLCRVVAPKEDTESVPG